MEKRGNHIEKAQTSSGPDDGRGHEHQPAGRLRVQRPSCRRDAGSETASAASAAAESSSSHGGGAARRLPARRTTSSRVGVASARRTGGSAIYGEGAQQAVDMAVEEINAGGGGYTIEIVNGGEVADDAQDATPGDERLQPGDGRDNPEALVGSFFSSVTLPMAAQAASRRHAAAGHRRHQRGRHRRRAPPIFRNCFIDPYQGTHGRAVRARSEGIQPGGGHLRQGRRLLQRPEGRLRGELRGQLGIEVAYDGRVHDHRHRLLLPGCPGGGLGGRAAVLPLLAATRSRCWWAQARSAGFTGVITGGDGMGRRRHLRSGGPSSTTATSPTTTPARIPPPAVVNFVQQVHRDVRHREPERLRGAVLRRHVHDLVQAAEEGGGTDTASLVEGHDGHELLPAWAAPSRWTRTATRSKSDRLQHLRGRRGPVGRDAWPGRRGRRQPRKVTRSRAPCRGRRSPAQFPQNFSYSEQLLRNGGMRPATARPRPPYAVWKCCLALPHRPPQAAARQEGGTSRQHRKTEIRKVVWSMTFSLFFQSR